MKIIAIGDTHGRPDWKKLVEHECDKFVFIGDYFDTYESIPVEDQLKNFYDIVQFKAKNPTKVVLLLGNHDFHYLSTTKDRYSGHQGFPNDEKIGGMLQDAIDHGYIQVVVLIGDILFSHAGVTKTWCKKNNIDPNTIEDINYLFERNPDCLKFVPGQRNDPYGDDITQSPIWVRPRSLAADWTDHWHVVGHTTMQKLVTHQDKVAFIDCVATSGEYLEIENYIAHAKKI